VTFEICMKTANRAAVDAELMARGSLLMHA
jgi:hypothetical protein